jgi:hypothetical protein
MRVLVGLEFGGATLTEFDVLEPCSRGGPIEASCYHLRVDTMVRHSAVFTRRPIEA